MVVSLLEIKIDSERRTKMLEGIDNFRKAVEDGVVKEYMILANEGDQWKTWWDCTGSFVTRAGALFTLILHTCSVQFEKE